MSSFSSDVPVAQGLESADLQSQLEELFVAVWSCEAWSRTEDRIDVLIRARAN